MLCSTVVRVCAGSRIGQTDGNLASAGDIRILRCATSSARGGTVHTVLHSTVSTNFTITQSRVTFEAQLNFTK